MKQNVFAKLLFIFATKILNGSVGADGIKRLFCVFKVEKFLVACTLSNLLQYQVFAVPSLAL